MDEAIAHCTRGIGIWDWASNDAGGEPDVVMACAGDVPTLETLAAVALLREHLPDLQVRVVNVVDLMRLQPRRASIRTACPTREFDALFTADKPVIFAYHGYPWLIHRLTYRRTNHGNLHVRGYKEEGTTTTPFDMVMLNDLDRFHLVMDVIDRVPGLGHASGGPAPATWPTSGCATARTRASTARTRPRSATGPGRADARAAARRQRGLEQPQAARARRRPTHARRARRWSGRATARSRRDALDGLPEVDAVGHRVVHGGDALPRAGLDRRARCARGCDELTDLAPLHQPRALAAIDALGAASRRAGVACFDTAFHATLPPAAATYALPATGAALRLRRFGFHGLSHAYAARRAAELLGRAATTCGSSPATSARARRCARSPAAARSTRRWASRRSRGS